MDGGPGDHPGQQELGRDSQEHLLAWREAMLDLHRFVPIYTDLHRFTPIYTGSAAQRGSAMDLGRGQRGVWGITRWFLGGRRDGKGARCCRGVPTRGRRRPANGAADGDGTQRDPLPELALPAPCPRSSGPAGPRSAAGSRLGKLRHEGAAPGMVPEVSDKSLSHKSCPDGSKRQGQLQVRLLGCARSEGHGCGVLDF